MNNVAARKAKVTESKTKIIDFGSLPFDEQKQHFLNVAQRALPLWGYPPDSKLKLLNITENATYRVEHPDFKTIVMRVHRLIYAEKESIETEIAWILDLRKDTALNLATPLKALNNTYVQTVVTPEMDETRYVVCFSYVKGKAPRDSHDDSEQISGIAGILNKMPKKLTVPLFCTAAVAYDQINKRFPSSKNTLAPGDIAMYRKLGEIAATIHSHSKSWAPPAFYKRIEWDWRATFAEGWNNFYGAHYRDIEGILNASDLEAIDACAFLMRKRVEAYGKSPDRYGMIHSDLRMANLLKDGEEIAVLDFDDCGRGWYMYDIASIVGFMEHRPDLQKIIDVIVEGYKTQAELPEEDEREIPTFIMMRRIGLLQAIIFHIDNTDPGSNESAEITPEIMAFYAKGTVILARKYVEKFKNMPLPAIK
jgi:Ser/Thr protein kinase RdoA (MazF antagonist)